MVRKRVLRDVRLTLLDAICRRFSEKWRDVRGYNEASFRRFWREMWLFKVLLVRDTSVPMGHNVLGRKEISEPRAQL